MLTTSNPTIAAQIQGVAAALGLTPYGISHAIAAETDPTKQERMACEKRWQEWVKGRNLKRLETLEADLNALGYCLKIEKL
jgi:hypothetical protein